MRRPEQQLQKAIVNALRLALPSRWIVSHYPAGGYRSRVEGSILKGMGVLAGFPDIMIFGEVVDGAGLATATAWFLEVKSGKGEPTPIQREMHNQLRALGFDVAVVRSIDDALEACLFWHLPLRMTGI